MKPLAPLTLNALVCLGLAAAPARAPAAAPEEASQRLFAERVRAVFAEQCFECHGGAKTRAGFDLASEASLLKGGENGPAVVPGHADQSLLWRVVAHAVEPFMPHQRARLPDEDVAAIRAWIDAGARYDRPLERPREVRGELVVTDQDRQFWSFRPLSSPPIPDAPDGAWPLNEIDRFVLARLESQGLRPAPTADKRTLIRRLAFDLTGLPPTPEEIDAFVADESAGAYETLVDRLLASPRRGERWARHWLDVARYADSDGYETDSDRPTAYRYRDFVIRAFNDDLPYDQFARWQLAGDEYEPDNHEALIATGFVLGYPNVFVDTKLVDELARDRQNELDDMLSTTGAAFLGLTVGCARCHDHKYDPIPTRDYYRLLAAFVSTRRTEAPLVPEPEWQAYQQALAAHRAQVAAAEQALKQWLKPLQAEAAPAIRGPKIAALPLGDEERSLLSATPPPKNPRYDELSKKFAKELRLTDADYAAAFTADENAQWNQRRQAIADLKSAAPPSPPSALALADLGATPEPAYLLDRGDPLSKRAAVSLGFLTVLTGGRSADGYLAAARSALPKTLASSGQRRALADWLTDVHDGAGGLAARVIVNRVWAHHFGEGLVRTPSDFGAQGEPPTHPELLEWLAHDLATHGWRLKRLSRLIVTSAAYRLAVTNDAAFVARDPENRLLARRRPMRLEPEALRDAMLAVSGRLNLTMYGPGFKPPIPPEALNAYNARDPYPRDAVDDERSWRRSVYMFTKRSARYPLFETFDGAEPSASCPRRIPTTVAPQALALMNDAFVRARARDFAERVAREAGDDDARRIDRAYRLALGRPPNDRETAAASRFLTQRTEARRARGPAPDAAPAALCDFCQALFCLNEFLYVD